MPPRLFVPVTVAVHGWMAFPSKIADDHGIRCYPELPVKICFLCDVFGTYFFVTFRSWSVFSENVAPVIPRVCT